MIAEGGKLPAARLRHGFRLAAARTPTVAEIALLQAGLERRFAAFTKDKAAAAKLLAVGESPAPRGADPVELAAYTTVAGVLLNLDEVITKQ